MILLNKKQYRKWYDNIGEHELTSDNRTKPRNSFFFFAIRQDQRKVYRTNKGNKTRIYTFLNFSDWAICNLKQKIDYYPITFSFFFCCFFFNLELFLLSLFPFFLHKVFFLFFFYNRIEKKKHKRKITKKMKWLKGRLNRANIIKQIRKGKGQKHSKPNFPPRKFLRKSPMDPWSRM